MATDRIILWRHGQTSWNVERRFQGQTDIPLDEVGLEQAERASAALAQRLAGLKVRIVASDLKRALATAEALSVRLGLPVQPDERLRESNGGQWEGLTPAEIRATDGARYESWFMDDQVPAGGGESRSAVGERSSAAIRDALAQIQAADDEVDVLVVVAHGGSLKAGMLNLLGLGEKNVASAFAVLGNTCWSELERLKSVPEELADGGWRMVGHNLGPVQA